VTDSRTEPIYELTSKMVGIFVKYKGNTVHTYCTPFNHLLWKKYTSMEYDDLWMGITFPNGRVGQPTCSEEVIERIRNQSGHSEGHKNVLWNQEG
jgi:hypothetical protein